jgi:hypothetical protein
MTYDEIFHGGDTHKHRRVIEAPAHCRADHVKKASGECVITVYPERPEVQYADLVFDRAWQGRIYDEQGYLDCAVSRGERRSHDISGGLLLIGREL